MYLLDFSKTDLINPKLVYKSRHLYKNKEKLQCVLLPQNVGTYIHI